MYRIFVLIGLATCLMSCKKTDDDLGGQGSVTTVTKITSDLTWEISTDKAIYAPGATVRFQSNGTVTSNTHVRYRCGSTVVGDEPLTAAEWTWTTPSEDGKGYLVEIYRKKEDGTQQIVGTIGVDVSSDWKLYPRYGFVATFDNTKTEQVIAEEMAFLNRCHINGVQFQDWHYKHHYPAPLSNGSLMSTYTDIANRQVQTKVVRDYIAAQHAYGMQSIFYNLCYGALSDAQSDGVKEEWYLFHDGEHSRKDWHDLPDSWKSDIYLMDPTNADWQHYLADRNEEVYSHFDFDGFQIDQLGWRGDRYTYQGQQIDFGKGFASFITAMKQRHPDKRLIMNAVGSYCSQAILQTNHMDFAYNECWEGEDKFSDLRNIIRANDVYSAGKVKTVFAAYMNYKMDNCAFNIPGVLLTDAVMFALGGSHLELGDHMLCREYFPYTGVYMSDALREQIIRYYDFMTAYENLLRGGGEEKALTVSVGSEKKVGITAWPPKMNKITTYTKQQDNRYIVHLLNFLNANSLSWRDMEGTMPAPRTTKELPLVLSVSQAVKHVYCASPDYHGGALVELPFQQVNGTLTFTVPTLKYWDMLIIEH